MISLKVNGISLPVKQQPLQFRFKSPLLHKTDGSVIYNLEVPVNALSKEVFGYAERLESIGFGQPLRLNGELFIKGLLIGEVGIEVTDVSTSTYKCALGLSRGLFNYQIKDLSLQDLLKKHVYELPSTEAETLSLFWQAGFDMADELPFVMFPVKNEKAFEQQNKWPIPTATITELLFQNPLRLVSDSEVIPIFPQTPFFKLHYVLSEIAKALGYNLILNDFQKELELSRLVVYSNNCQFTLSRYYGRHSTSWNLGDFLPQMKVSDFLQSIETAFNGKLIPRGKSRDASFLFVDEYFDPKQFVKIGIPMNAIEEVNYQAQVDSFKFRMRMPSDAIYSNLVVDLDPKIYTFKGTVDSEVSLPSVASAKWGDVWQSVASGAYYTLSIDDANNVFWQLLSLNYNEHKVGESERIQEFETLISPMITAATDYYHGQVINCPITEKEAFGNIYRGTAVDSGLRLLFYRGTAQSIPDEYPYPLASSDNRTLGGEQIEGANYAIRWQGPGGFLDAFWKFRLNWMSKGLVPVKCRHRLSIAELSEWEWMTGYMIGSRGMVSSLIEGEITPDGVVNATMEFYPL